MKKKINASTLGLSNYVYEDDYKFHFFVLSAALAASFFLYSQTRLKALLQEPLM